MAKDSPTTTPSLSCFLNELGEVYFADFRMNKQFQSDMEAKKSALTLQGKQAEKEPNVGKSLTVIN
jgi:hypothetical protein